MPNNEKLSGTEILELLNKVESEYSKQYIDGTNLKDVRENWDFLKEIKGNYHSKLLSSANNLQSGTTDAAYIYYSDDNELQRYFDDPYQEEYKDYRQILFISRDLGGKPENPLNALRHSGMDLTGKIDLENKYYYLYNYDSLKRVSITADGKPRSNGEGNNCIRAKSQVEIKYSKDDRCYFPIEAKGTLNDPNSEIHKYLEINNDQIHIKYDAFANLNPEPRTKKITFDCKDKSGKKVDGAKIIIYKTNKKNEQLTISGGTRCFQGEEIITWWIVYASKEDKMRSDKKYILPAKEDDRIEICMHYIKKVEITAIIEDRIVHDFNVKCSSFCTDSEQSSSKYYLFFADEKINEETTIEVSKCEGNNCYVGSHAFIPKENKPICVQLKKAEPEKQEATLDTGKSGQASAKDSNGGNEEAQNEEKEPLYKNLTNIAIAFVALICIVGGIWLVNSGGENMSTTSSVDTILNYCEGIELNEKRLNSYKNGLQEPDSILHFPWNLLPFLSGKKTVDSTEQSNYKKQSQALDKAIALRQQINKKEFAELKKRSYSQRQKNFKQAVNKIDSTKYGDVAEELDEVSGLDLDEIADKINEILISEELKGGDVNKKKLQEWKNEAHTSKCEKSIDLYLQFWELVIKNNVQMDSFGEILLGEVKKDDVLKSSDLKKFLEKICKNSDTFRSSYKEKISGIKKTEQTTLDELKQQLKIQ
ncbi:MAG: hypothetical protein LBD80_02955 [Tannerella sp.]|nr:hypothetical protein [Tannerella sp.]